MSAVDALSQLQLALANHLRHPEHPAPAGLDERRLRVYRELVSNNISSFIHNCFPVSRRIHGADWQALISTEASWQTDGGPWSTATILK